VVWAEAAPKKERKIITKTNTLGSLVEVFLRLQIEKEALKLNSFEVITNSFMSLKGL
jgi:hypothetical protein